MHAFSSKNVRILNFLNLFVVTTEFECLKKIISFKTSHMSIKTKGMVISLLSTSFLCSFSTEMAIDKN